jgi:hypothetical protein
MQLSIGGLSQRYSVKMTSRSTEIAPMEAQSPEEEIKMLEIRLNQLKLDYEKYFLGSRPTEPAMQRAEVQKMFVKWSNTRITNTALRFKFNSVHGRYQAFKRRWDDTLRQIDAGTYKRHVFKADLHDRERGIGVDTPGGTSGKPNKAASPNELFETYRDALMATGQDASKISPAKLQAAIRKQEAAVKKKYGCERVDFKVVVQDGKVKVKAAAG